MAPTYQVKSGDTLYSLAKTHGITVEQLKKFNNLSSNNLQIGQELNFSAKTKESPSLNIDTETKSLKTNEYKIQKGDSLWKIAKSNGCDIKALAILNGLDTNNPTIKPGQTLVLPATKHTPQVSTPKQQTLTSSSKTTSPIKTSKTNSRGTIMLDIGHGVQRKNGRIDPGAIGADGTTEFSLNKEIIDLVKDGLEEDGYNVILTDHTKAPGDRLQQKLKAKPDIFLSLHMNAGSKTASGEEVLHGANQKSSVLAAQINQGLAEDTTIKQRRTPIVQRNGLAVLKGDIPSVLVEAGFISNPTELKKIQGNKKQIANSIRNGINNYYTSQNIMVAKTKNINEVNNT